MRRAKGGANILGVFRVKNHDFTPINLIFSNCGARRETFWGISCEKSRFYAKKSYIFQFYGGGGCAPHGSAPAYARKITPMSSIEIAFYIHNLIIIIVSLDIHVYVYYTVFTKLLQEIYFENCFYDVPI
jgi:hypothetical protein